MTRTYKSWGSTPDMGNPMATEAEHKYHCNLWRVLKNQHDSFINIGHALHTALDKAIPDQLKPVQQIGNHVLETAQLTILWRNYARQMVAPQQQTSPRLTTLSRPLGTPLSQLR